MVLYRLGWDDLRGESHRRVLNTTTTFDTIPRGPTLMFVSNPTRLARTTTPSPMDIPPSTTTAISLSITTPSPAHAQTPNLDSAIQKDYSSCLSPVMSLLLQTRGLLPLGILVMLLDVNRLPRIADPLIAHGARSQVPSVVEHVMGKGPLLRLVLVLSPTSSATHPNQQQGRLERKEKNSHAAQKSKTAPPPRQTSPAPPPRPSPAP